jgi:hypothetical protein
MKGIGMAIIFVAVGGVLGAAAQTPGGRAEPVLSRDQGNLDEVARRARTASDHADVARRYREQSEALMAQAAELDHAARTERPQARSPLAYKWPALDGGSSQMRERQHRVAQSQQAALAASRAAAYHHALAVEKGLATTAEP